MSSAANTDREPCPAPPMVRRAHKALYVGLAVFFAVLIGFREPFRGYQAEVRVRGPKAEAIDPNDIRQWVAKQDISAATAVSTLTGGRSQVEIRIGRVAPRLPAATVALDDLARRLLAEHLPRQQAQRRQQELAALQSGLAAAREAEAALQSQVTELHNQQLAMAQQAISPHAEDQLSESQGGLPESVGLESPRVVGGACSADVDEALTRLHTRLESLRLELAGLLASFTDEHPQVLALRRQIASLEEELRTNGEFAPAASGSVTPLSDEPDRSAADPRLFEASYLPEAPVAESAAVSSSALSTQVRSLEERLRLATTVRESAEARLQATLTVFAADPLAADWSAEPARLVTRLGGTPRMLTITIAIIAAAIASVLMFRATRVLYRPQKLRTAREVAAALAVPLAGQSPTGSKDAADLLPVERPSVVTPRRVRLATQVAEGVLLTILGICVVSFGLDPTLAGQFGSDPFGVLSETVGRLFGA